MRSQFLFRMNCYQWSKVRLKTTIIWLCLTTDHFERIKLTKLFSHIFLIRCVKPTHADIHSTQTEKFILYRIFEYCITKMKSLICTGEFQSHFIHHQLHALTAQIDWNAIKMHFAAIFCFEQNTYLKQWV